MSNVYKYVVGVFVWHALFVGLGVVSTKYNPQCYINNFGVIEVGKGFVRNIIGVMGFRAVYPNEDYCAYDIYLVQYYFDGLKSGDWEYRTIESLVDVDAWKLVQNNNSNKVYSDSKYIYVVYNNSDGISASATPLENYE